MSIFKRLSVLTMVVFMFALTGCASNNGYMGQQMQPRQATWQDTMMRLPYRFAIHVSDTVNFTIHADGHDPYTSYLVLQQALSQGFQRFDVWMNPKLMREQGYNNAVRQVMLDNGYMCVKEGMLENIEYIPKSEKNKRRPKKAKASLYSMEFVMSNQRMQPGNGYNMQPMQQPSNGAYQMPARTNSGQYYGNIPQVPANTQYRQGQNTQYYGNPYQMNGNVNYSVRGNNMYGPNGSNVYPVQQAPYQQGRQQGAPVF